MLKLKAAAFGAMTLVLFSGAVALGQDRGGDPRGGKKDDAKIDTKSDKGAAPAVLSEKDLGDMLTGIGQAPKAVKLDNGKTVYVIIVKTDAMNVQVVVGHSPDGSKIWVSANFRLDGQIPSDVLQGMLEANAKHGPAHFSIFAQSKTYNVAMPLDNRNLTAEELQRQINTFSNVLRQTEPLWNPAKWAPVSGGGR
jgi:hypothetical protein